jgi:acyl-coenzyme A thioesterase 9
MLDSFDQAIIPLGSDRVLRDKYLTHLGGVRIGRLLEDMDIFAVHLVIGTNETILRTL